METIINNVLSQMQNMLDPSQLKHLAKYSESRYCQLRKHQRRRIC